MKKKMIFLVTLLSFCFAKTIYADDYISRPQNVVANLGDDVTLSCQLEDNNYLNWIIKGMIFDPSDENLQKKCRVLNDGSLLIKSVGRDDVGPYDCHSSGSFIHSKVYVDLVISDPTCHCQWDENECLVNCSVVYFGDADILLEFNELRKMSPHDSLERNLVAAQMKSKLNRTETRASITAAIKSGNDSLLYEFKVEFVHEPNDQDKPGEYSTYIPKRKWIFNKAEFFQKSSQSTILPEIRQASDQAYDHTILVSGIIALFVLVSVNLCWTGFIHKRTNPRPDVSPVKAKNERILLTSISSSSESTPITVSPDDDLDNVGNDEPDGFIDLGVN